MLDVYIYSIVPTTLQWGHNECHGISNHQYPDCLLSCFFLRRRSKKTSKFHVTGLCEGNPQVTGGFPSQRASNTEYVSFWWCHHERMVSWEQRYSTDNHVRQDGFFFFVNPYMLKISNRFSFITTFIKWSTWSPKYHLTWEFYLLLAPYKCHWPWSPLVKIMACHLFGAKPLYNTNDDFSLITPQGIDFIDKIIEINQFLLTTLHLKLSMVILLPFCPEETILCPIFPDICHNKAQCKFVCQFRVGHISASVN